MKYINYQEYVAATKRQIKDCGNWTDAPTRWPYHAEAIHMVNGILPDNARVLEGGAMGVSICHGSDTIDSCKHWIPDTEPTYKHDMRITPWPIATGVYDLFIALRVWHHLMPLHREALAEARRVARFVLLGLPTEYSGSDVLMREVVPQDAIFVREIHKPNAPCLLVLMKGDAK